MGNYSYHLEETSSVKDAAFFKAIKEHNLELDVKDFLVRDSETFEEVLESMRKAIIEDKTVTISTGTTSDMTTPGFKTGITISIGKKPRSDRYPDGQYNDQDEWVDDEEKNIADIVNSEDDVIPVTAYFQENTWGIRATGDYFVFPNNQSNPSVLDLTKKFFVIPTSIISDEFREALIEAFNDFTFDEDFSL